MSTQKTCSYPRCRSKAIHHIAAWGDVWLCGKHHESFMDLSLMPMGNGSELKKILESEHKFSIACGASKDFQKHNINFISRRLKSGNYITVPIQNDWLKSIQKTLNELKTGIRVWPIVSNEDKEKAKKSGKDLPDAKYNRIKCPWCNQMIPKNGAAQFSHLKKHVNELMKDGKITEEEAKGIRSVKLDKKYAIIFKRYFKARNKS